MGVDLDIPPTIEVELEGRPEDDGYPTVEAVSALLDQIKASVRRLSVMANSMAALQLRIIQISFNSPLKMRVELHSRKKDQVDVSFLTSNFLKTLDAIEKEHDLPEFSFPAFDSLSALAKTGATKFASAKLRIDNIEFQLDRPFEEKIEQIDRKSVWVFGSVNGRLEQVNIHNQRNIFAIYPMTGPRRIICRFHRKDLDRVVGALDRRVEVSGKLYYRPNAYFTHLVDVDEMRTFPILVHEDVFARLWGIAPKLIGRQASDEFVRDHRNAWT
ncbi:hypothetical protein [Elioraea sp.]|uniref:hypothetical protein n=1 Tax=Elioraea sp. TaxID=2185103 RepID=UPI003F6E76B1